MNLLDEKALLLNKVSTEGWQFSCRRAWCSFHTQSGLVAVLMTSFTDTPFFSSCSVLPLSVREVQWNEFFLFASYVLLFFLFQIFLLPRSYLFMFCSAFVHSLQQVYDWRLLRAEDTYNGKLYRVLCKVCSLRMCGHSSMAVACIHSGWWATGWMARGSLQGRGLEIFLITVTALGPNRYVIT